MITTVDRLNKLVGKEIELNAKQNTGMGELGKETQIYEMEARDVGEELKETENKVNNAIEEDLAESNCEEERTRLWQRVSAKIWSTCLKLYYPTWYLVFIALSIAMMWVGNGFMGEESCKFGAAYFLYYGGIIGLVTRAIGISVFLASIKAKRRKNKVKLLGALLLSLEDWLWLVLTACNLFIGFIGEFVVLIWGSVVVLENYATWEKDDKSNDNYCHNTPMMFTFVLLIVILVLGTVPLVACLEYVWKGGQKSLINRLQL